MFRNAVDTEFRLVEEEKRTEDGEVSGLPTKEQELFRHHLSKEKSDKTIEDLREELQIDKELGLLKQVRNTAKEALKHDIDELTSSRDYFEVSQKLIRKLFKIRKLQGKCLFHNVFEFVKSFIRVGIAPLSTHIIMLLLIFPMIQYTQFIWRDTQSVFLITLRVFNIPCWFIMLFLLYLGFALWQGKAIKFNIMNVKIVSKSLSSVEEKIPYGAKLKVLEAKRTGIFEDFVYIYPQFIVEDHYFNVVLPSSDPAILGVTADKRMYMIVYWDIEKDIEKVVRQIEHFKKFKLDKTLC